MLVCHTENPVPMICNLLQHISELCAFSVKGLKALLILLVSGKEVPNSTLQLVHIYFDSATFDEIEKDKKIKLEAQISLIGGTMGLLTGFSIISGVEIIFFLFRLVASFKISKSTKNRFGNHK